MRRLPISEPLLGLAAGGLIRPQVLDVVRIPLVTEEQSLLHQTSRILLAVVTAALGWLVLSIPVALAALLGAALCPIDPVLASTVGDRR